MRIFLVITVCFLSGFGISVKAQSARAVDFINGDITLDIQADSLLLIGEVTYSLKVLRPVDSLELSSRGLQIDRVSIKRKTLRFREEGNSLWVYHNFKPGKYKELEIKYRVRPEKAVYFPGWRPATASEDTLFLREEGGRQVWTQGQGKYSSSWVPSFDDMTEKVTFTQTITADSHFTVLANGSLEHKKTEGGKTVWKYAMDAPMSSYLLAFAVGEYREKSTRSASGVPIYLYYYPSDSLKTEPSYRYSVEIFDFLEQEIGVPFPWKEYKQVPVRDFLYAGMENTTLTLFSDSFMIDSLGFADRNYVNVNAHELAHQWFGDLVTETDGEHHWLHEGFATYYALLAERELFGEDHYYWNLYQWARQLDQFPEGAQGEALMDRNAGSLTFYFKGAWALHRLREITGDSAFRAGIKAYLNTFAFKNVTTDDLLQLMETHSGKDLSDFRAIWLEAVEFPTEEAYASLKRSDFIRNYIEFEALPVTDNTVEKALEVIHSNSYYPLKQLALEKTAVVDRGLRDTLYLAALKKGDLYTRQGVAMYTDSIGAVLKPHFESLLQDESYLTKQEALIKLWSEYPAGRVKYLEATRSYRGPADHSLRILWLGLALLTPGYEKEAEAHYKELMAYTGPAYDYETRRQAFGFLAQTGWIDRRVLLNLVEGLNHPAWQFSKFCRGLMNKLALQPEVNKQLKELLPDLQPEARKSLQRVMEKMNGTY